MEFIDLHVHSKYTVGNATTNVANLINQAKEYGMNAIALTDSATVAGFTALSQECALADIKPIYGCGFYFTPGSRFDHSDEKYHLTLLAKDDYGFANLLRLLALAFEEGYYTRPRIDFELLQQHSRGLICLSGGMNSIIDKNLINKNKKVATHWVKQFKKVFGDSRFYLELQRHGSEHTSFITRNLVQYSEKYVVPLIATGGSFYLKPEDYTRCNRLRKRYNNNVLPTKEYYFRSSNEMEMLFIDVPEALFNSTRVADRCNVTLSFKGFKYNTKDPREHLYKMMAHFGIE